MYCKLDGLEFKMSNLYFHWKLVHKQLVNSPNGIQTKTLDGSHASGGKLIAQEEAVENKADVQDSGGSQKRSNPTLDRMKL